MLLDADSLDLVQHIDTVLAAVEGSDLEHELHPELMQSVLEIATPVCRDIREVSAGAAAAARGGHRGSEGYRPPGRLGGYTPVQPVREAADHRTRPVPRARRPAPVRRPARAHLRHAHPRRDRRPREGRGRAQRHARPPAAATRAQRVLAFLARRGDGARVHAPARLRRLPALRPSPTLPGLRRLLARRRPARALRAASPTTRISGGTSARTRGWARSRCGSATQSPRVEDAIAIAAFCQSS